MSLSVCCLTSEPGPRVAALLRQLRPVADEIVVAADAVVGEADLRYYAAYADRLLRVEFAFLERHLAWLHARCSCEWILRVDGDEVVSAALIEQLPALTRSRDVLQYRIPRRWLFPDAKHWLDEAPWSPDYQIRLVRNDGTLRFPGLLHTSAAPVLPTRYLDVPLYHLACLLKDAYARRAHAFMYGELQRPTGEPERSATAVYSPEAHSRTSPADVPAEEHPALADALRPRADAPASSLPSDLPVVPLTDSDRFWTGRAVPEDAYAAEIAPIEREYAMSVGERRDLYFRVANRGSERWSWDPGLEPLIRAAYRWVDDDGAASETEPERVPFVCDVRPGESVILPVAVRAPEATGTRVLEVDLVHEHVRWFGCPLRVAVRIAPADEPVSARA